MSQHLVTNRDDLSAELMLVLKLFFPDPSTCPHQIRHLNQGDEDIVWANDREIWRSKSPCIHTDQPLVRRRQDKHARKQALYNALCALTTRRMPWGSLTGIRPTRLAYQMLQSGSERHSLATNLQQMYGVSQQKSHLVQTIIDNQRQRLFADSGMFNIYIGIPFCPSRCTYCSFLSLPVDKCGEQMVEQYLQALHIELQALSDIITDPSRVLTVYVGGGTPSVLSPSQLTRLLDAIPWRGREFTFECGRPETITATKLDILAEHGVDRICINPQSMDDATLARANRRHTASDIIDKVTLAQRYDMAINMDLIAGLDGESVEVFVAGLDRVLALRPHNITVHTLALKRGAQMALEGRDTTAPLVECMVDAAAERCFGAGYNPYYLYRQKNCYQNLENIGWALPGYESIANITTIEETCSVLAVGAGAISKRVIGGRIDRFAAPKDILLYVQRLAQIIDNKAQFFASKS